MKVAIVHDYIKEYGGAERVLEALHEIWPKATVFTSVFLPEYLGPHKNRFMNWKIKTSFFQNIPFREKLISPMRIFGRTIFEHWDFSQFDAVIVSATGAYIPNLIRKKTNGLHICYCHTPPRYLYGYPTARNWTKTMMGRMAGGMVNHKMRLIDFEAGQRVDFFIANSNEVKRRIKKFYRREATVIYPPVEMADKMKEARYREQDTNKSYYLAGGRLARAKHIDLVIEAANKMKFNLKIFGKAFAGYDKELKSMAGPTVEFVGEVGDEELVDLYENSRALIYPSEYEDFGIMPIEAQAFGKGVVAFRQGGVKESVIEGKTGVFFDQLTTDDLISAIKRLERNKLKPEDCIENARKFTKERFKREILKFVNSKMQEIKKNA
ncbi:hypothetical protein A2W14_05235 [Candidatus Gottesmanbacteria bacterium RBG_16_37_8]|uniref:Glycosyl transferase family 1 domain-containing protein n=1 Tax=Candidatus Gottesmanbacteria bacterium RBG_16_37_8 TaxID=1798371 RepID=A0A1F5YSB6_9BACT|nr:MAG: hypothetical protein A2W14_05235 [Candidatus Gottesmanbacteria bacterium RBG_16_37_8]